MWYKLKNKGLNILLTRSYNRSMRVRTSTFEFRFSIGLLFQGLCHYLKREIQIINAPTGHVTVFEPRVYDDQKGPMICVRSGTHYQVCKNLILCVLMNYNLRPNWQNKCYYWGSRYARTAASIQNWFYLPTIYYLQPENHRGIEVIVYFRK